MNPTTRTLARADFTYELRGPVVLVIEHEGCSVSCNPEEVITELAAEGLDLTGRRIVYRDTAGLWDELKHKKGRFAGFRVLNARSAEQAIARLLEPEKPGRSPEIL